MLTIATSRMKAKVTESSGLVTYTDLADNVLVSESSKSLKAATVEGVSTNTVQAAFNSPATEALFGLGQHQDGVINRKGSTLHMLNANTQIQIPVLVSNKGYGLFWDNYSTTDFTGNAAGNTQYSFSSETGDLVDYYFFYGPTIDQVVANYRATTGRGAALPQVGLRPLPVEGPLSELVRALVRRAGLSEQQHSGRRDRSGLAVLEPVRLGLPADGPEPLSGSRRAW